MKSNLTRGLPALFGSDTFTGALSRAPGENVGQYLINQGTLKLDDDYVLTYSSELLLSLTTRYVHDNSR